MPTSPPTIAPAAATTSDWAKILEASATKPRLAAVVRTLFLRELTDTKAVIEAPPSRLAFASDHAQDLATLVSAALGRPLKVTIEPMPEDRVLGPIPDPGAQGQPDSPAMPAMPIAENDPEDHPLVREVITVFNAKVLKKEPHKRDTHR